MEEKNIDKVVLSDDNELNSIISTRAVSVDFDNDSINYPIFEESPTCAELSETEANNSSSDKIYSLKWETDENRRWKLRYGDHSYVKNGWFLTEGKKYHFNKGICSSGWEFIDDKWYYFDAYTGAMVTEEWRNNNNQWFYLGKDGYIIESEAAENTDILVETTECPTDQTEDQSHNSALEFSSDFSINYDEETGEFYIIGTKSSNNKLEKIAFTYCTPYEIFSDA